MDFTGEFYQIFKEEVTTPVLHKLSPTLVNSYKANFTPVSKPDKDIMREV